MTDNLTPAEKAWQNSPGRAAEQARKDFNTARFTPQPWQPVTHGLGDTSGGTSVETRMENMWSEELQRAAPADYLAVQASISARRQELNQRIADISARYNKS
jgi:hypothetical protein